MAEHAPQLTQLPLQSREDACTEHASVLQSRPSIAPLLAGHLAPPPDAAVVTLYIRDCLPPPQVAEHAPQLPQLPMQFIAGGGDGGGVEDDTLIVVGATVCEDDELDTTCPWIVTVPLVGMVNVNETLVFVEPLVCVAAEVKPLHVLDCVIVDAL